MAELKTQKNDADVIAFLNGIEPQKKRDDSFVILELMEEVTGEKAKMWGASIIGFGSYQYKYANGRDAEWMLVGFSPRKQHLVLYIMPGFEQYDGLLDKIGKHKTGKSCFYIKKIEDIDMDVLRELVKQSVEHMIATNP